MTCIVGIQHPGGVTIGGDSAGNSNWVRIHRGDPKVFVNGGYLLGFTTSYRMGQLLRYADLPKPLDRLGDDLDRFVATEWIDAVREVFKSGGFAKKDAEREEGGAFLLGVNGRLYHVDADYQIGWSTDGYATCGNGWEIALGALYATRRTTAPEPRVAKALQAAAYHCSGVHGPFTIITQPTPGVNA